MIRILQVVNIMDRAGLENVLMNYYRNIDRTKVQFDFLTHRTEIGAYDAEIMEMGGRIYKAPRLYPQNYPQYFRFMKKFFQEHQEYKIVHSHIDAMSYLPLLAAKHADIPIRIAHSHSTNVEKDFKYILKQFFRHNINFVSTHCAACSNDAGRFLFGKRDCIVIPNALDINKFKFNAAIRENKRNEMNINDAYVIGHVGRFTYPKNHKFLLDVFEKIATRDKQAVLLLIGAGELLEKIKLEIENKKISNRVVILSNRDDVHELYQAMDMFAFPSLYEGLGLAAVEAQISGLPCIVSECVPKEAKISENIEFLNLNVDDWVEMIMQKRNESIRNEIYSEKYDIVKSAEKLEEFYEKLFSECSATL